MRFFILRVTFALLIVAITPFATKQWAAAMLGYQPALGDAWLHIFRRKVYAPWKLFVWWPASLSRDVQLLKMVRLKENYPDLPQGFH